MAENRRKFDALIHRAVQDVQVSPADPGVPHVDCDLALSRRASVGVDDGQRPISYVAGCSHGVRIAVAVGSLVAATVRPPRLISRMMITRIVTAVQLRR